MTDYKADISLLLRIFSHFPFRSQQNLPVNNNPPPSPSQPLEQGLNQQNVAGKQDSFPMGVHLSHSRRGPSSTRLDWWCRRYNIWPDLGGSRHSWWRASPKKAKYCPALSSQGCPAHLQPSPEASVFTQLCRKPVNNTPHKKPHPSLQSSAIVSRMVLER